MNKWVYRLAWIGFISLIVINFFHPNIYMQHTIQFMELIYWILTAFILLIITITFLALKFNSYTWSEKKWSEKELNQLKKYHIELNSSYGKYSKYIINVPIIVFTVVMMNDYSLAFLFILNFSAYLMIKKLMVDCIKAICFNAEIRND